MQNNAPMDYDFDAMLYLKEFIALLHLKRKLIAFCTLISLLLGVFYIVITAPNYTATASILIDPRQTAILPDRLMQMMSFRENLILDSQIEVIQSSKLIEKAAERAGISDEIEIPRNKLLHSIRSLIFNDTEKEKQLENEQLRKQALQRFRDGLEVSRVNQTYVLNVSYTSQNPHTAAGRANLIADIYLEEELVTQYEASQRINKWLKEWLSRLKGSLNEAEQKVEDYKSEKNILGNSRTGSITDQQLSELNSNLIIARTETAQAKARYESMKLILEKGNPEKTVSSNVGSNRVLNDLRTQHIDLSKRASQIKRNQGEDHKAYSNLMLQIKDIEKLMADEYKRAVQGYKNEYEIALSKQKKLEEELEKVSDSSFEGKRDQIELRDLQRNAGSLQDLYTKLLTDLNEQVQRQTAPFVQGRVISYAMPPQTPSWPNKKLVLLFSLIIGAFAGMSLVFIQDQFDKYIRKSEDLEKATQRTCLGMIPKVKLVEDEIRDGSESKAVTEKPVKRNSGLFNHQLFEQITHQLDQQTGVVAEVMRNIQLAIKFSSSKDKESKTLSFVSANPGEGKSTTSCFLAKHLAKTGAKVALVDCDFRRPSLTNLLLPNAKTGFYELAYEVGTKGEKEATNINSICHKTGIDNLSFVPAKGKNTPITNLNLVASGQMNQLIMHLRKKYDVVIIDLPAIMNISDARATAQALDSFVFIAHWGETNRNIIRKALSRSPEVYGKIVGSLLTQVPPEAVTLYGYDSYYGRNA